jgi:hypothetical protein
MHGENDKMHVQFWSQNLKKIGNLENLNVPWEVNILIYRALVNSVINPWVI